SEGRYTLRHLPAGHFVAVVFERADFTRKVIQIDTSDQKTIQEPPFSRYDKSPMTVVRSPLNTSLAPQPFARVKVIDHTGKPVTGGEVQVLLKKSAVENGEAIIGLEQAGQRLVAYKADPDLSRLGSSVSVNLKEAGDTQVIEIPLPEPVWVTGRVVDA